MAGVDEVISSRLKLLNQYVDELRSMQGISFKEYQDNKLIRKFVERTFQTAIEACLDVGNHLISSEGFRYPEDNKDIFQVLHEEGIVSSHLLPRLIRMAGFRSVLVHNYADLDDAAVYGALKKRLGDFDEFARAIVAYLERESA